MQILFIDGRNFLSKIREVLNSKKIKNNEIDFASYDFLGLFDKVLQGIQVERKIFYLGKLIKHNETAKKSENLIEKQRQLKTRLEKQGFEVFITGSVRGHLEKCPRGHELLTFKEKGVDVQIAVDMMSLACRNELKLAIIGSSDSDLQPVIKEVKNLGVELVYLGFEQQPNKGLTYTTNRTILIRNAEVLEFFKK